MDERANDPAERERNGKPKAKAQHYSERNREGDAINSRKLSESTRERFRNQATCVAGAGIGVAASPSRSRRRIAFSLPPRSRSKQVRYIQVSNTMMDASAR